MKAKVIWADSAIHDLEDINEFLELLNIPSRRHIIESILDRTRQLTDFPSSGTIFSSSISKREYRFLVLNHYKIIYSIRTDIVYIESVFDTRQNPEKLKL